MLGTDHVCIFRTNLPSSAIGRFRTYTIIFAPQANTPTLSMNLITEIGFET